MSEEVAQDVLLEVWRTAPRFDPRRGKATTGILTMAHRRAVDRVRSGQAGRDRAVRVGISEHQPAFDATADAVERADDHRRSPEEQAAVVTFAGLATVPDDQTYELWGDRRRGRAARRPVPAGR